MWTDTWLYSFGGIIQITIMSGLYGLYLSIMRKMLLICTCSGKNSSSVSAVAFAPKLAALLPVRLNVVTVMRKCQS